MPKKPVFQSTRLREARQRLTAGDPELYKFQSTRLREARLETLTKHLANAGVSIHAPT